MEYARALLVSMSVLALGAGGAVALERLDQELRIMHTEYTLVATDLGHVLSDIIRYRNTMLRATEAQTPKDYARIIRSLPTQRRQIQQALDRFALVHNASGNVAELEELKAVQNDLRRYFDVADRTKTLLDRMWQSSGDEIERHRTEAERNAMIAGGQSIVEVTLSMEALLGTVAKVGKQLKDRDSKKIRLTSLLVLLSAVSIAVGNLVRIRPSRPMRASPESSVPV